MTLSIRLKLALLAGVPVIGAAILSAQIASQAIDQMKLARSLGSVESLVELSQHTTELIHSLERERTDLCLATGYRVAANSAGPQVKTGLILAQKDALNQTRFAIGRTDEQLQQLKQFLAVRNAAALPKKLANSLSEAEHQLATISEVRQQMDQRATNWEALLVYYERVIRVLMGTVAGLAELTNDGELLRSLNALVAILELEASASTEHALLAHVLAAGEFPPGSYRNLVTLIAEQELYQDVFSTVATFEAKRLFDEFMQPKHREPVVAMRKKLMAAADDELTERPEVWLDVGRMRLEMMAAFEQRLHVDSAKFAAQKLKKTRREVSLSAALAVGTILFNLAFARMLARGITRRLSHMREVVEKVGDGNLAVRADVSERDELGKLGEAFNTMVSEISESRLALHAKARMARDLEIATEIQRAMLPKAPTHPEFEFAGNMEPADEVGGDFYDVLTDGEALWITVGDVCGHGIGSGLVMVMTQIAFASSFIHDNHADPAQAWQRVNRLLYENIRNRIGDDRYVTAQLLTYQGEGRFLCVGAHQWPIIYRAKSGKCEIFESTGPWLALTPEQVFVPRSEILLDPGDVLCLYSDGLPESQDANDELFDVDRMQATLAGSMQRHGSVPQAVADLYAAVAAFSGRREDDWTLLLVRRRDYESCRLSRLEPARNVPDGNVGSGAPV